MRAIQEEVDRAREKRLLREKGMHEFIFMFERGGADHLHSDSFIQHVKQHLPSEDQDWKIALISLTLAQQHEDVRQAIQMSLNLSQCISSTYFFFFVPQSELEKKKEAKQREREAREKEARKREKAEEKEKRRREYNAQQAAVAAREQQKKKNEEKKKKNGQAAGGNKGLDDATPKGIVHDFILKHLSLKQFSVPDSDVSNSGFVSGDKKVVVESSPKPRRSFVGLMFKLFILLLLGLAGVAAACRLTDLKEEAMCVPVNVAVDDGLTWAKEQEGVVRQLLQNLSSAAKEFLESTQASKN